LAKKIYHTLIIVLLSIMTQTCASNDGKIQINPAFSLFTRLRVFVQPLQSGFNWRTPYHTFAQITIDKVAKVWQETGIYEVISLDEAATVTGSRAENLDWFANNSELARDTAKKLKAEYAMLVERKSTGSIFYWDTSLINAATGRIYKVSMYVPGMGSQLDFQPIIQASYDQLFRDAKEDMLSTALRITQNITTIKKTPVADAVRRDLDFDKIEKEDSGGTRMQIAIYDFRASKKNQVVAQILSEALRQELLNSRKYKLVSRESTAKILDEMSLQMTGVVDQQQAVRAGKGLAAKQIVLGQYENLGNSSILQVKRINVELQQTLGTGTLRCRTGEEDEMLKQIPQMAKELSADK
jgi:hypothetical protein